jgi:hypothetical protein
MAQKVGEADVHFLILLAIFGVAYFAVFLPLFQLISRRIRGRKFVIRLGTPWTFSDPEHRWDVLLSFVSFMVTLAVSVFILDWYFPLPEAGK